MKARRDEDLGDAAREMATKVLEEGTPMTMGPMDARSRRIVHVALKDVAGVETKSEGEGAFRRVRITASGS
jgi:spoIIIJ-associated protein